MKHKKPFLYQTSMIWKMAIASGLSWELAVWFGSKHPYLAPLSVILCLQVTIDQSIQTAVQRMLGTLIGVLLTVFVALRLGIHGWSIGLVILVCAFAARLFKMGEALVHQAAFSALLVLIFENSTQAYALDRIRDTGIGVAVAVLIQVLVQPPDFTRQAQKAISSFSEHLHRSFLEAASWIEKGGSTDRGHLLYRDVKELLNDLHETLDQLEQAEQSLKVNPFRRRSRAVLQSCAPQLQRLRQEYVHFNSMIRTLVEWSDSGQMRPEDRSLWGGKLRALASYLKEPKHQLFSMALPPDFEKTRYSFSLYNDVLLLLKDFS